VAPVSRTLVSYIDSCDGLPVLSEALACARRLDWLSAEAPEAIVARLAAYAAHLECRVLLCPAPGVSLAQIESAVGPLPPHVQLKIGFGLPTGHSLYVLTDAHDNQVFFHQQPGEGEATLIASWSAPPAVEEIGWRRRRFELLWEDQLRPLVRVEPLGPSLESLFALS